MTRGARLWVMLAAGTALLAGAAGAGTARDRFTLHFDILSPPGFACEADAPGSTVRVGRDLRGEPMVRVMGDARAARITCTAPDGSRWLATANRTAPYTPSEPTLGTVVFRPGKDAMMTIVRLGERVDYQFKTFVRVD